MQISALAVDSLYLQQNWCLILTRKEMLVSNEKTADLSDMSLIWASGLQLELELDAAEAGWSWLPI